MTTVPGIRARELRIDGTADLYGPTYVGGRLRLDNNIHMKEGSSIVFVKTLYVLPALNGAKFRQQAMDLSVGQIELPGSIMLPSNSSFTIQVTGSRTFDGLYHVTDPITTDNGSIFLTIDTIPDANHLQTPHFPPQWCHRPKARVEVVTLSVLANRGGLMAYGAIAEGTDLLEFASFSGPDHIIDHQIIQTNDIGHRTLEKGLALVQTKGPVFIDNTSSIGTCHKIDNQTNEMVEIKTDNPVESILIHVLPPQCHTVLTCVGTDPVRWINI